MRSLLLAAAVACLSAPASLAEAADAAAPYTFWLSRTDVGTSTQGDSDFDWDTQGWIGSDEQKAWVKTTGNLQSGGSPDRADVQLLYSRAIHEFWDVQVGVRQTLEPAARSSAVLGVQGLAPYWFEIDAAGFLSEGGRLTGRFEGSYELTLTQRVFAEPFVTARFASKADPKLLEGSGFMDTEAGVRLRYEFSRNFAPYVGVSWARRYGSTKRLLTAAGGDAKETSGRVGLRLLF